MAKMWKLLFQFEKGSSWGTTDEDSARTILGLLTELDPPPKRLEYIPRKWVEADFFVEADDQLNAVKAQNEIDKKLRDALKGNWVTIKFSNPIQM